MAGNLFIKRPKFAIVVSIVIILAGLITIPNLPLEEYPSITPPQIVVTATYNGANSDVLTSTVAAPIELQLNGVENMLYMTSTSQDSKYQLTLFFRIGTNPDMALVNVQNQLQLVIPRLPEEVQRYGLKVKKSTGGPGVLMIAVTSPNHTYDALFLSNYAKMFIKDEIARVLGVSEVNVYGKGDYSIRVWLNPEKMASLGVSVEDVRGAITSQNIQTAAGTLGTEPTNGEQLLKIILRTKGRLKTTEEFENIVIKSKSNASNVKLKDVARIELGAENYSTKSKVEDSENAMIAVTQLPEANSIDVANRVNQRMKELSRTFPKDLSYHVQYDQTAFVRESIKEVKSAIILAIILVSLVTYLFLGTFRAAFIPFCAIPVSLIGVFIFLGIFGFSINLLILFGLVLAVGLVVDDAIVVLENAQRHIQDGKTPKEATEITMKEVLGAIVATSLVLMAVFVPVSFLSGITGQMFRQFAICIATSIGLSTVVALSLSPALCSMILKSGEEKTDFEFIRKFEDWFNGLREKYLGVVEYFVTSPKKTFIILASGIIFIMGMYWLIPKGFLPDEDRGALFTQIQLPDSATLGRTEAVAKEFVDNIKDIEGVQDVLSIIGWSGENSAICIINLEPWHKRNSRKKSLDTIKNKINQKFVNYTKASIATFQPPAISGMSMFGGLEYQLLDKGDRTPEELYNEMVKFVNTAGKDPAFSRLFTTYSASVNQKRVIVDEEKALALGVNVSEIYNTLAGQIGMTYVNDFNKFGRVYRVYMQADAPYRSQPDDINKIYVKNHRTGQMLPLTSVVRFEDMVGPNFLTRFNLYPSVTINALPTTGVSSGTAMDRLEKLSYEYLPEDMGFAWSGSSLQEKESAGQIGPILTLALIFVYLFLVALYESWTLPVAVMLVSPLALIGALFFQYIAGYALDIYAQVGLVMLIGLGTKQAILIVEFAKDALEKSGTKDYVKAALEAAKLRFRAVMMTNIAFILGLVPLITAKGAGAGSRHSIGMTVFGGMIAVAFVGSIMVPAFYVMVNTAKDTSQKWLKEKLQEIKNKKK